MPDQYEYPFDPHGTNPTNLILDERKSVSPAQYRDYVFIMPRWAPFFEDSLVVRHWPSGIIIAPEVGWVGTHVFLDASHSTANRICGSFSLKNINTGVVSFDYRTVGGKWNISENQIIEIISNTLANPRTTTWEQVTGVPEIFPVIAHNWRIDDLVGAFELMESIDSIAETINQKYDEDEYLHALDTNNPHATTAQQTGAYSSQQIDLILQTYQLKDEAITNSLRLGGLTLSTLRQAIYDDGVSNSEALGGLSLDDLKAWVESATVDNATHFGGMDLPQHTTMLQTKFTSRIIIPADTSTAAQVRFRRLLSIPNNLLGVPYTAPFQCIIAGLPAISPATLGSIDINTSATVSILDTNILMSSVVALHDTLKPNYLHVQGVVGATELWYRIPIGETCPEIAITFVDNRPSTSVVALTSDAVNKTALPVLLGNRSLVEFLRNEVESEFITLIDTMTNNFNYMTAAINQLP